MARGILHCYHHTATFRAFDVIAAPYDRQSQYAAENSAVIRITFLGTFNPSPYQMDVAVMTKGNSVRAAVLGENTAIRYNKNCGLEEWSE
jgi:hypothetical protein